MQDYLIKLDAAVSLRVLASSDVRNSKNGFWIGARSNPKAIFACGRSACGRSACGRSACGTAIVLSLPDTKESVAYNTLLPLINIFPHPELRTGLLAQRTAGLYFLLTNYIHHGHDNMGQTANRFLGKFKNCWKRVQSVL